LIRLSYQSNFIVIKFDEIDDNTDTDLASYAPKEAPINFSAEHVLASINMMSDFSEYSKDENPFCQKGKGSVLKSFVSKS
jgi:hypothetical protein